MIYKITKPDKVISGSIDLPASKSISNRLLMIRALCDKPFAISNLSEAEDTHILQGQLNQEIPTKNAVDAGTAYRFLCAYLSITKGSWILTGSERMKKRPIGSLVDGLRELGADVTYLENQGFPPLQIKGKELSGGTVTIRAEQSSQFITALMLIAPKLKGGLTIHLIGKVVSKPYIKMTMSLMRFFGVPVKFDGKVIQISEKSYQPRDYIVESDWSAASYYFALAALAQKVSLELKGLRWDSIQGDKAILKLMEPFGLITTFNQSGVYISGSAHSPDDFVYDFTNEPDLAQTLLAVCAAKGIMGKFSGLDNLIYKETDRIAAMKLELAKIGRHLYDKDGIWHLMPIEKFKTYGPVIFNTYNDHRMAMALSVLSMVYEEVFIAEPLVVKKSNPDFWDHLAALDFTIEELISG